MRIIAFIPAVLIALAATGATAMWILSSGSGLGPAMFLQGLPLCL